MSVTLGRWTIPDRSDLRSDPTWRYPLLAGTGSIPFTIVLYWLTPDLLLVPVFVGGLLTGYVVDVDRPMPTRVGIRTGAVGSIGLVPISSELIGLSWNGSPSHWIEVGVLLLVGVAILVGITVVVGAVGSEIGNRLSEWVSSYTSRTPDV